MAKKKTKEITIEEANILVEEHHGWAQSIAKSVARAWSLDWQGDGLDGAAMEALIFCSRRFDISRGVPFKGYARKRIHEACCEASRKSKGWRSSSRAQNQAREVSIELLNVFPELRSGNIPGGDGDGDHRGGVRQLLMGASIIAAKQGFENAQPDEIADYKKVVEIMAALDPVHQLLLWEVYWEGNSMRTVAQEWETDELNVIREHTVVLTYLQKSVQKGKQNLLPKVRPGLKPFAIKLKRKETVGQFSKMLERGRQ